jgi:hypothetical protein
MYASIERTDEGDVVVGRVAQYVRAVEVGLRSKQYNISGIYINFFRWGWARTPG